MYKPLKLQEKKGAVGAGGWAMFAVLAVAVAVLGGASRADAGQLVILRPVAALFLIPAIYLYEPVAAKAFRAPLICILVLLVIMILQLIPLPPSIWQSLPGREFVAELSLLVGQGDYWRPMSLTPTRTLNALFSLIIPVVALLIIVVTKVKRTTLLYVVASIGFVDALIGLAQIISSGNEWLYQYRITNHGSAVGLFANENHSAVFGAISLMVIAYIICDQNRKHSRHWQSALLFGAFVFVLLPSLTAGSRAGLLSTLFALLASAAMFLLHLGLNKHSKKDLPTIFGVPIGSRLLSVGLLVAITSITTLFFTFDRAPALQSLTSAGAFDDMRFKIIPVLTEMVSTFWFWGAGFGSFEEVYHIYEPAALMTPEYVNQAHNDWAQFFIEGGVPALSILVIGGIGFLRCLTGLGASNRQQLITQVFWIGCAAVVVFASLVDYPLRTPLFQFAITALLAALILEPATD
ncbi:O-antigen ligase family protein [Pontixanthobacter sp.]|uniref:O-antigen ligase family protein n=1 Tax=Pontixanthobacter sp. TaxID=2792078 RepID=UPI003C7EC291